MKTLRVNLDTKNLVDMKGNPLNIPPQRLMLNYIITFITNYGNANKGLDERERYCFHKIMDAFQVAIDEGSDTINLDDEYFELIVKSKAERFMPDGVSGRVEQLIEEARK